MPPKSAPRSGTRRRRGGNHNNKKGPLSSPLSSDKRRIDKVNDETFGTTDEMWNGMDWQPEDKLVAEFEEFKLRQRYSSHHEQMRRAPSPPPASDPLAQLAGRLDQEDIFRGWSSAIETCAGGEEGYSHLPPRHREAVHSAFHRHHQSSLDQQVPSPAPLFARSQPVSPSGGGPGSSSAVGRAYAAAGTNHHSNSPHHPTHPHPSYNVNHSHHMMSPQHHRQAYISPPTQRGRMACASPSGGALLSPLTKAHRQQVIETGASIPPGWLAASDLQPGENGRTWMTNSEVDAVLRTQLNLMERANQALTRPQTIKLSNEQQLSAEDPPSAGSNSFGRGSYSSARGPREALDVEIGAMHTSVSPPTAGSPSPTMCDNRTGASPPPSASASPQSAMDHGGSLCTCDVNGYLGADFSGVECEGRRNNSCLRTNAAAARTVLFELEQALGRLAVLKELERRAEQVNDPNVLIETTILLHSLFVSLTNLPAIPLREVSFTVPGRRLLLISAYDKGLRLTGETWSTLLQPPAVLTLSPNNPTLDCDAAVKVLLYSSFRQCRYITAVCKRVSCALFYDTFLRLLSHTLASRSSLPLQGPGCPLNLLERLAWDLLTRNRIVDPDEVRAHEGHPHLVRIYLLIVVTLCRLIQESPASELFARLAALCRVFLTGYVELIAGRDPSMLEGCLLVPDDRHEALLATPPMSCIMFIILAGLQLCSFEDPPSITLAQALRQVAELAANPSVSAEEGLRRMPDRGVVYVMVAVTARVMIRQSLRLEGVLTRAVVQPSLAPTTLTVDVNIAGKLNALVPAANCLYGVVGLALKDEEIEGVMKRATASNGCSAEGYLMALHSRFQCEP